LLLVRICHDLVEGSQKGSRIRNGAQYKRNANRAFSCPCVHSTAGIAPFSPVSSEPSYSIMIQPAF
jgi:hypothetical protein